jgi:chromosome segregation ATPase
MTARREVPLSGDTLSWVHTEIADLKARLSLVQQAAEQSRGLATDAADKAHDAQAKADIVDSQATVLFQLQEDLRLVRDQLVRLHDDISSLRQSREETERRALAEADRHLQDRNESGKRFAELQKQIDAWQERVSSFEDLYRRNLEIASQLVLRLEALENDKDDIDIRQSRTQSALTRIDQEINRLSSAVPPLQREDDVNRERVATLSEMLRRVEVELEAMKAETNRIDRINDRVELVQAERSRHGERLNEMALVIEEVKAALNAQFERLTLVETRMGAHLAELKKLDQKLIATRDQVSAHLRSLAEMEAEFRKRQVAALEKETRDIRSRGLDFAEE